MNRSEILKPGEFAGLPKSLMATPNAVLPASAKLVFAAIVERFGDNGHSWPGFGTIARDTGLSRRRAVDAVNRLARLGLIMVSPPAPGRNSNCYECCRNVTSVISSLVSKRHYPSDETSPGGSDESSPELPNGELQKLTTERIGADAPRPVGLTPVAAGAASLQCDAGAHASPENPPDSELSHSSPANSTPEGGTASVAHRASSAKRIRRDASVADAGAGKKGKGGGRPAPLTDDEIRWITADARHMAMYLRDGIRHEGHRPDSPPPTHWGDGSNLPAGATVPQAAAWTWSLFAAVRQRAGLPLSIPALGRLIRATKALRGRMPHDRFVATVLTLARQWPAISAELRWMNPTLDEGTLASARIMAVVEQMMTGGSVPGTSPLTDAEKTLICSSPENMGKYIRFGIEGVRRDSVDGLPRTGFDWTTVDGWSNKTPHPERWTVKQTAGFWWLQVSHARAEIGERLTMPDYQRLVHEVTRFTASSPASLWYPQMVSTSAWWKGILMLSEQAGVTGLMLNEASMNHRMVQVKLNEIACLDPDAQANLLADAAERYVPADVSAE